MEEKFYILWNPMSPKPPTKRLTEREAYACAESMATKYGGKFYVCMAVAEVSGKVKVTKLGVKNEASDIVPGCKARLKNAPNGPVMRVLEVTEGRVLCSWFTGSARGTFDVDELVVVERPANPTAAFNLVGRPVRLNSGGPVMRVYDSCGEHVACEWYDGVTGDRRQASFHHATLTQVSTNDAIKEEIEASRKLTTEQRRKRAERILNKILGGV